METLKQLLAENLGKLVFWGYNSLYCLTLLFIFLSFGLNTVFSLDNLDTFFRTIPLNMLVMVFLFFSTPLIAIGIAGFTKLSKSSSSLLKLFFGFEIPLMGISLVRMIFLREVSTAIWLLFLPIIGSVISLLIVLLLPEIKNRNKNFFLFLFQQTALVVWGYAFILGLFFLPIVFAFLIKILFQLKLENFLSIFSYMNPITAFATLLASVLAFITLGLVFLGPIGAFITTLNTSGKLFNKLQLEHFPHITIGRIAISVVYIFLIAFFSIQNLSQTDSSLLTSYKNATTFEDRQKLAEQIVKRDGHLKHQLTSSYLAPYRYLSDNSMNILTQGYINELGLRKESANVLQQTFNKVAIPFIYQGSFNTSVKNAADLYEETFDNPIQKGEAEEIIKTLEGTNTQDTLKAGLIDSNKPSVLLVERQTKIEPQENELLTKVTVEEEYENKTNEQQEVYYEFSLPEDSVITELKLGPDLEMGESIATDPSLKPQNTEPNNQAVVKQSTTTDGPEVNNAVVAPKGAANQTFDGQIFRRSDPALIVQTGPRQYKLRVFPIPVAGKDVRNQKVRFSYITLGTGSKILPNISEERNVFTTTDTKKTIIGSLPTKQNCTTILGSQTSEGMVVFKPNCKKDPYPTNQKIALLLDSSYSNKTDWKSYLEQNSTVKKLKDNNQVDTYFFNTTRSIKNPAGKIYNLGKTNRSEALSNLSNDYDLILMLTDSGSFDKEEKPAISNNTPIYLISINEKIPPYSDTLSMAMIGTNGKVVTSIEDALDNFTRAKKQPQVLDTTTIGTWILQPDINERFLSPTGFSELAQKKIVYDLLEKSFQSQTKNEFLDKLNAISKTHSIVTPYSSMIVLVDDQQRQMLAANETGPNRYDLALGIENESLGNPSGSDLLSIGAVPEPHEWLLIIIGSLFLLFRFRKKFLHAII